MTTIRPHELTPEHVNKRARVVHESAEIVGRLGPYQHEINWIYDGLFGQGEGGGKHRPGPTQTSYSVGGIDLFATQYTNDTIEIIEENA